MQVPVIACRYAGKDNLAAKMAAAIVAHQDHPAPKAAGTAAALMLERVILGQSIPVRLLLHAAQHGQLLCSEQLTSRL